ncbi:hypothetical protein AVEN_23104-1 [Araneus ventricosus]|uniref:Uncharacterized protein n=1 Tax=Araneus ventricosus TaxID=182803 RepID=A0A4Y2ILX9_ARAVE|nr:hypothetical protein AVEN_23104-1 [Araneus ventricosus]
MVVLNLLTGCPTIDIKIKEENEIWQQQQGIKNLDKIGISFTFDYATELSVSVESVGVACVCHVGVCVCQSVGVCVCQSVTVAYSRGCGSSSRVRRGRSSVLRFHPIGVDACHHLGRSCGCGRRPLCGGNNWSQCALPIGVVTSACVSSTACGRGAWCVRLRCVAVLASVRRYKHVCGMCQSIRCVVSHNIVCVQISPERCACGHIPVVIL